MHKARLIAIVLIIIGAVYFGNEKFPAFFSELKKVQNLEEFKDLASKKVLNEIKKQVDERVLAPAPLRVKKPPTTASLTLSGVIEETNIQRELNGFAPLLENSLLNSVATLKAEDILKRQYFAHVSPSGEGAGDLAKQSGYEFIMIGENLALGNFESDKDLVNGWMNSPGHRANILHNRFTEIGVAVKKGAYEGQTTWVGVQTFGLPKSACPETNKELLENLEINRFELDRLGQEIEIKKAEIENTNPKHGPEYSQKIDEYNTLVNQYNVLIPITQKMVEDYNAQVKSLNACIEG